VNDNFNSGLDHESTAEVKAGSVDGFKLWSPVDAIMTDESRYGVIGLAGTVSEWTATWSNHPDFPDRKVPLKRGASFATGAGFELTARRAADSSGERNFWTGFRIVSDRENPESMATAAPTEPISPFSEGGEMKPAAEEPKAEPRAEPKDESSAEPAPDPKPELPESGS
jgi:hypothetical protein